MQTEKKVAVVILGWNGEQYLRQFLPSVVRFSPPEFCEVIVADNCSTDGSLAYVRAQFPQVRVIENTVNAGYAGGYNEALRQVNVEYFVLLNQDVEVTAGWIDRIIDEMDKTPNIAAAQPKIRAFLQKDYFEYAGACGGYVDKFGYAFCRGRLLDTCEKDEGQYDTPADIFWASGACLFVRRRVYWEAGGLDESFFAHQEEIDLCWRINSLGYRLVNIPGSVVYHVGGGSLEYGSSQKIFLNFRNNLLLLAKNLPASALWFRLPVRLLLDWAAAFKFLVSDGKFVACLAVLRAHGAFFTMLPDVWRKRKNIAVKRCDRLAPYSIVWQYFLKKRKKYSELPQ